MSIQVLCPVFNWNISIFRLLSCMSSLHILDINPLSGIWLQILSLNLWFALASLVTSSHQTLPHCMFEIRAVYFFVSYTYRLNRCIMWELWVKFYLGQNEGCSSGDSISGNSEKLLQRGSGGKINIESEVTQSCLTLCDLMDCSLPGSSVLGIFQARVLEWVAIAFSRGSSWPRDWTQVSCIAGKRFTVWATREVQCGEDQYGRLWWRGSSTQSRAYFKEAFP